jgi:hypothetical protein
MGSDWDWELMDGRRLGRRADGYQVYLGADEHKSGEEHGKRMGSYHSSRITQ